MMQTEIRTLVKDAIATGTNVAWGSNVRNAKLPRVRLLSIGKTTDKSVNAVSGHVAAGIQIDVHAKTYRSAKTIADQIETALDGYIGGTIKGCLMDTRRETVSGQDIDDEIHTAQLDFTVTYNQ